VCVCVCVCVCVGVCVCVYVCCVSAMRTRACIAAVDRVYAHVVAVFCSQS
jgi:hypothetical protein